MKNLIVLTTFLFANTLFGQGDQDSILNENSHPLMFVENMPHYPSCANKNPLLQDKCTRNTIYMHIRNNYKVPDEAKELGLEGTTYVQFIVNKQGKITDIKVSKSSSHEILDNAAKLACKNLPDFIPGIHLGSPVGIIYTLPVKVKFN